MQSKKQNLEKSRRASLAVPADKLMVGICLFAGVMINLYLYNEYLKISEKLF